MFIDVIKFIKSQCLPTASEGGGRGVKAFNGFKYFKSLQTVINKMLKLKPAVCIVKN